MARKVMIFSLFMALLMAAGGLSKLGELEPRIAIPEVAWERGIGEPFAHSGHPKVPYPMIDDGYWQGAPIGGFGSGSIGHTYRGDFARWHLDIGSHRYEPVWTDQFSLYQEIDGESAAYVLFPGTPPEGVLEAWRWGDSAVSGSYHALYPRAWYVYDTTPVQVTIEQFSPIIPHNYRETSYPVGIFLCQLENKGDQPATASIMLTWENLIGGPLVGGDLWRMRENYNFYRGAEGPGGRVHGIVLSSKGRDRAREEWQGEFAIAALESEGVEITYRSRFLADGDGEELWADFADDGRLANVDDQTPARGRKIGAAIDATVHLTPGERRVIPFALAWDLPIMTFGSGHKWFRRYTEYFGTEGTHAFEIALEALTHYQEWREAIEAWQGPILNDPSLPDWYKATLFNELYYLVDGGTAWENGPAGTDQPDDPKDHKFSYLECFDYDTYSTLDVRFYSAFPLAMFWPEIEKGVMRQFAATVDLEDRRTRIIGWDRSVAIRKARGALPHDLGSPREDPWLQPNYFTWQNTNEWKDLNPKFVLQVWRAYVLDGRRDQAFLEDVWPAIKEALEYVKRMDEDGDGIPENGGFPDQTYDTWEMEGVSAYCGSLWLAALKAAEEIAEILGDEEGAAQYRSWFAEAQPTFEAKLWNGRYYKFDETSEVIMADQLVGEWWAELLGLPSIVPQDHLISALRTIYEFNVMGFQGGQMGAVNGMLPDGTVDRSSEQSQEVWSGVTYALASLMLSQGMVEEAFVTARGVYNVVWSSSPQGRGYWFRTPEAWDEGGNFRASMYMRPQAIWAIQLAKAGGRPENCVKGLRTAIPDRMRTGGE